MTASESSRIDRPLRVCGNWAIGPDELRWRFSRSSGPGGQGVNTADSRVELSWTPSESASLSGLGDVLRLRVLERLSGRLVDGAIVLAVSENRAQLRNREAARLRLARLLQLAVAPPPAKRRPSKPTRGSIERRLAGKKTRAEVKARRARPTAD